MISVQATPAAPAPTTTTVDVLGPLADDPQRVEQRGEHDDRRAVLVVVEDGDVELGAQPALDLEAARARAMSSRLMPPNVGAAALTNATISSTSLVAMQSGNASTPANSLKSIALPSITGIAASGPMSPRPSTAVPSETTATVLPLIVSAHAAARVLRDRHRHAPDARRVGHREVVARLERQLRVDLDLAALVHQERAVGDAVDRDAVQRADGADDGLGVRRVDAGDGDVADHALGLDAHEVDRAEHRVGLGDGVRDARERAAVLRDLQPHREAVGRGRLEARRRARSRDRRPRGPG